MKPSSIRLSLMRPCGMIFAISTLMVVSVRAGDHHKTVYYVPVQAAPAAAAAPVQYVTLQPKHHRTVYLLAAPVQTVQVVQVAASPVMMTVAASPAKPASIVINGVTYVAQGTATTVGSVGGAPVLGGLTADQRAAILGQLKDYYASLKTFPSLDADSVKKMVRDSAVSRYEETVKDAVNTDDENKAVDSLANEATGGAPTSTDTPRTGTTTTTVAAPAPVEYFLPVKLKQHPLHHFP